MLVTASAGLKNAALGIHILAVIVAFVIALGYPLVARFAGAVRKRPQVHVHRLRVTLSRYVVNPALLIALIAGIYLASDEHQWQQFYVQWGIAAIVVLFGLEGAIIVRGHKRQAELAAASNDGDGKAMARYDSGGRATDIAEIADVVIILLTAIFMFAKP